MPLKKSAKFYEFDSFRLSVGEGVLSCAGQSLSLTPKAFETLLVLIENRGQIVSREELMAQVWNDTFVEENCLTKNISTLRKVLGDDKNSTARFIETVPRRGYRFVAAINEKVTPEKIVGSLAVLPFRVFGVESGAEYLGLGLADILITRLSNLPQIAVRPTGAVRKYDVPEIDAVEIGRELKVDWILEGSLLQIGKNLRATLQFISVAEARPLWGEKLNEEASDLIAVQDLLAEKVTRILIEKLAINEGNLNKPSTSTTAAFKEYLEGRFHWSKRTTEGMQKAVHCFERAIKIDPQFALAFAGLGDAYLLFNQHALLSPKESFPKAKTAARAAISLDPTLAEAHTTLAHVAFLFEWNWREAEFHYRRAIKLNPNYATAHHWFGLFLRSLGRFEEAIDELGFALELDPLSAVVLKNSAAVFAGCKRFGEALNYAEKAIALDPHFALAHRTLGWIYAQQKNYPAAIAALEKAVRISPHDPAILNTLGCIYAAAGHRREAFKVLGELEELQKTGYVSKYEIAQIFVKLGDFDKALELLEKAFDEREMSLVLLGVDPDLDELRRNPRFIKLTKYVGF